MKKYLLLLCLLGLTLHLGAQQPSVKEKVEAAKKQGKKFSSYAPFKQTNNTAGLKSIGNALDKGVLLEMRPESIKQIHQTKPDNIQMILPGGSFGNLNLELVRYRLLADGFKVTTDQSGGEAVPYEPGLHYRGVIQGSKNSLVAISIFKDRVMGVVESDALGHRVLGKLENDAEQRYILYDESDLGVKQPFDCGTLEPDIPKDLNRFTDQAGQRGLMNCVKAYLESEYDLTIEKGGVNGTVDFLTGLYNVVAAIYQDEDLVTEISEIFVWTTQDNYPTTSTVNALTNFRTRRPTFNGDVAHLISRGAPAGGGVAWVDALCSSYAYAYSYIASTYNEFPTYSWSVNVIAHEMGHNLGSYHTHDCVWNGNNTAIDGCGPAIGYTSGCDAPLPTNGGTIMSYCHLISSVGINLQKGFGPQPGDVLRTRVGSAVCLNSCENPPIVTVSKTDVTCFGGNNGTVAASVISGGTPPFTYHWSDGSTGTSLSNLPSGNYSVTVTDAEFLTGTSSSTVAQPENLSSSATASPETISGAQNGAVDLTPSGGHAPYTYLWSNGQITQDIAGLAPGTYSCTTTDAKGCQTSITATVASWNVCTNTISVFPYTESFEIGLGLWEQESNDDFDWTRFLGDAPTVSTGPTKAYNGSYYLYTEATGNYPSRVAALTSPCFDLRNKTSPYFQFYYHMYGSNMGKMEVYILEAGNSTPTLVWTKSGNVGTKWTLNKILLTAYVGKIIQIKIVGTTGTSGEKGDMAIDLFSLVAPQATCAAPVLSLASTPLNCNGSADGSASVTASGGVGPYTYKWSNTKTTPVIYNLAAGSYTVTVTGANNCYKTATVTVTQPTSITIGSTLVNETMVGAKDGVINLTISGGSGPFSFAWSNGSTTEDLSGLSAGSYSVTVTDARGCNKTATYSLIVKGPCTTWVSLPYQESFESGLGLWVQSTTDQMNWTRYKGKTRTANTSPSAAAAGIYYLYTESTNYLNKRAELFGPCMDMTLASTPQLTFSYHMWGAAMGTLSVQVSTDGGVSWSGNIWSRSGDQGNAWYVATIDLTPYIRKYVKIRFSGLTGSNQTSDMAIDNIFVQDLGKTPHFEYLGGSEAPDLEVDNHENDASDEEEITEALTPEYLEDIEILSLRPNPTRDYIEVVFKAPFEKKVNLLIVDISGRLRHQQEIMAYPGENIVGLDLVRLPEGIHLLTLRDGLKSYVKRFIIEK